MKCWDLGGQTRFRSGWQRYAMGCDVILYVVDVHDVWCFHIVILFIEQIARVEEARRELHALLEEEELRRLPLVAVYITRYPNMCSL